MFSGSENHKTGYFKPFELVGATDQNGTTWNDRTNYFETVPTTALDMALWMESDRMGHLLGAIGQKELDTQRGVVQNEKRQDENQPYGRVEENIQVNAFPFNHPYHHDTIGSMKDLNAASLDDVKKWFTDHYGAAEYDTGARRRHHAGRRAAEGREILRRHPGRSAGRAPAAVGVPAHRFHARRDGRPGRAGAHLSRMERAATRRRGRRAAAVSPRPCSASGKTSRLYNRLVYKDKIADSVEVGVEHFALASMFELQVDVKKGVDPAKVEAAIADEWTQVPEGRSDAG